jgi:hypothetical protein
MPEPLGPRAAGRSGVPRLVVAKRLANVYTQGVLRPDWLKIKRRARPCSPRFVRDFFH